MAAAQSLRDLHALHQRAKALRDRLASGPKTLAARQAVLDKRTAELEAARKALKDAKAHAKNREVQAEGMRAKVQDLRIKLNTAKKQNDYDAIRNQMAHDNKTIENIETEVLEGLAKIDEQSAALAVMEAEVKQLGDEVARLRADIEAQAEGAKAQLEELDAAILSAEDVVPPEERERYVRSVKQRGADALAPVEDGSCIGCFVAVTPQMINELINAQHIVFCKTCGRILYLAEDHQPATKRKGK